LSYLTLQFIVEINKHKLEEVWASLQTSTCWSVTVHSSKQLLRLSLVFKETSSSLQFIKQYYNSQYKNSSSYTDYINLTLHYRIMINNLLSQKNKQDITFTYK